MIRHNRPSLLALTLLAVTALSGCRGNDTVRLSAVLPLSGEWQGYGEVIRRGIDVGLQECQADPGSPSIVMEIRDSQSDPQKAQSLLASEYDEGTWAVIGGVTTGEAQAMITTADEYNRVLLSPWASTSNLTQSSPRFYRVWTSDYREGMKLGEYARKTLKLNDVVTLAADSDYAQGIQTEFVRAFEQNGGKVVETLSYPAATVDFAELVSRVTKHRPDAVYLADYAGVLSQQIELLRQRGFRGHILTASAFATSASITTAGGRGESIYITYPPYDPSHPNSDRLASFVEAYQAQYDDMPDIYAAHGYDAMLVFCQALQNGSDRPTNFWKGLRSLSDLQGATGMLQFDERGDVQKWPRVYRIVEGEAIDHEVWVAAQREQRLRRLQQLRAERRDLLSGG